MWAGSARSLGAIGLRRLSTGPIEAVRTAASYKNVRLAVRAARVGAAGYVIYTAGKAVGVTEYACDIEGAQNAVVRRHLRDIGADDGCPYVQPGDAAARRVAALSLIHI